MTRSPGRIDPWTGVKIHLTLWTLLLAAVWLANPGAILPGVPGAWLLPLLLGGGLVAALWRSPRTERPARLLLHSLSLAALLLLAGEAALATFGRPEIEVMRYPYPYRMHGCKPSMRPAENTFGATTNDMGLRQHGARQPAADDLRVLVLGGSAVFGVGSPDDQTMPAHLERILDERLAANPVGGHRGAQVINAGQGWYNSTQELVFLATDLLALEPDVVVVVDGYNDIHHTIVWGAPPPANHVAVTFLENLCRDAEVLRRRPRWPDGLRALLSSSHLLHRLGIAAAFADDPLLVPAHLRTVPLSLAHEGRMQRRLLRNWTTMHRLLEGLGVKSLFSLQPTIFMKQPLGATETAWIAGQDYAGTIREAWQRLTAAIASGADAVGLRRFEADRHIRAEAEDLFLDYCHLAPAGNQRMASAVADATLAALAAASPEPVWTGIHDDAGDGSWRPFEMVAADGR